MRKIEIAAATLVVLAAIASHVIVMNGLFSAILEAESRGYVEPAPEFGIPE